MVDREGRINLANALTQLINGLITNDEFQIQDLGDKRDVGLIEIRQYGESLSHDLYPHRLLGKNAPSTETIDTAERCISFLHTELEYRWAPLRESHLLFATFVVGAVMVGVSVWISPNGHPQFAIPLWVIGTLAMCLVFFYQRKVLRDCFKTGLA